MQDIVFFSNTWISAKGQNCHIFFNNFDYLTFCKNWNYGANLSGGVVHWSGGGVYWSGGGVCCSRGVSFREGLPLYESSLIRECKNIKHF